MIRLVPVIGFSREGGSYSFQWGCRPKLKALARSPPLSGRTQMNNRQRT